MTAASPRATRPLTVEPAPPTGSGAVDEAIVIWRALAALGVRDVLVSPGSRSAPFVYGLADAEVARALTAHVRIDERAAAFTALGISRVDPAHPAVIVTTSGTAVAHLHAAVLEAHHSGVPLIALTADRPVELRGTGANQTTDQVGIFGSAVRFQADLPAPSAGTAQPHELRAAANVVARAVAAATGEDPGPVHLNVSFRDPLTPVGTDDTPERAPIVLTRRAAPALPDPVSIAATGRTVVVAGDGAGAHVADLAAAHSLPLLAEPSSNARRGPALVARHVSLLRAVMADPDHPLRPDRAIVLGRPTLSRPVVSGLLGADDVEVVVVDPTLRWADAVRRASLVVPAVDITADPDATGAQAAFLAAWHDAASIRPLAALDWQVRAALAVWDASDEDDLLVLGSSSLVRDLEEHAGPARARVLANRGLAGIDGLLGPATGAALRWRTGRVRALVGDLTALHDLTSLVVGPEESASALDIVVVDDDGGRIFSGLEHAAAPPALLRRFFTTPHGTDIAAAASALGVEAATCTADELPALLDTPAEARRVIVVRDDRS